MKVDKLILDSIERCYCAATLTAGGTQWLLLAGEAEGGPCYAYSVEDFSHREVVWEHGGGTMAIVQIPGRDGEFVAIQNFFPGFRSETAKLVRGKRLESGGRKILRSRHHQQIPCPHNDRKIPHKRAV